MLRFLIHLVGDIHQPLHNCSLVNKEFPKGDKGGNDFKIVTQWKTINNMHFYWDALLKQIKEVRAPLDATTYGYLKEIGDSIIKDFPIEKFEK